MEGMQSRPTSNGRQFNEYSISSKAKHKLRSPVSSAKAWVTISLAFGTALGGLVAAVRDAPMPVDRTRDSVVQALAARADIADRERSGLTVRVGVVERQADSIRSSIDSLRSAISANTYVGCATLELLQPRAIPPKECSQVARRRPQ